MAEQLIPDIPLNAMHDLTEQYRALESLRERIEAIFQVLIGGAEITDSSIASLLETTELAITTGAALNDRVTALEEELGLLDDRVADNESELATLLAHPAIADLGNSAITASAAYQQSELQQVADDAEAVSDKLDVLLATLRAAGVLNV